MITYTQYYVVMGILFALFLLGAFLVNNRKK